MGRVEVEVQSTLNLHLLQCVLKGLGLYRLIRLEQLRCSVVCPCHH